MMMVNRNNRRGVVLLVVLGLLAMFALVAVAFVVLGRQARRSAVTVQRIGEQSDSPRTTLNQAIKQVLQPATFLDVLGIKYTGPIDGHDLAVLESTLERAKQFYGTVFGWSLQDLPGADYSFFKSGSGGIGGGIMAATEGGPSHPIVSMMCDDIESTLGRIEGHGGEVVVPKTEFGEAGWLAHVRDTEGNLIGLWQARSQ